MSAAKEAPLRTVLVVGGGLVGMSCALNLQARGIATVLADPCALRAASSGNAGHVAVEQVEPLASAATLRALPAQLFGRGGPVSLPPREIGCWLPFAMRFLAAARPGRFRAGKAALKGLADAALPAWRRQLAFAGAPELLIENGHFILWESAASAAAGRARWARTDIGAATFREAAREELDRLRAHVAAPIAGGIRISGSAQIADLDMLAEALSRAFVRAGGTRLRASVRLAARNGRAEALAETGETLAADAVVVAAGIGARRLLEPLGHRAPLIAERGYHLQAARTDWPADLPPLVFEDRAMIVTRFRSGLRAAGLFEFGRAESPPDPRKWARLKGHLDALGIAFDAPAEWMGARPTLPDYLPAIGRSRRFPNLYYAFGHQHLGLTLAAATAEAIAALIAEESPAMDLSGFDIGRFEGRRG